jgi:hypothetical protein
VGFVLAAGLRHDRAAAAPPLEPLELDWEQVFQLSWEVSPRPGRPRLVGQIRNVSLFGTTQIRLLVEQLDAGAHPIAQQVAWLGAQINAGGSDFFDVPVPDRAAAYRVRVYAFTRSYRC